MQPSGKNSQPESELETQLRQLGNLPSDLPYPPPEEKALRANQVRAKLEETRDLVESLDQRVKYHAASGIELEQENTDPEPNELNMQLALTRLVADNEERTMARRNGKDFQKKYNLTNNQMFTLCRLAVQIGFYKNTDDLREYLDLYATMSPELRALAPDAIERLNLGGDDLANKSIIGSCSCSCP